ncbi:hypothetical protein CCR75_007643 [Bremia lactucae]|uniref:Phospholipid/glycerol acyltransferase domain-containing protein n=1 Tax=Bremia lactucae TaxID=4779 RepID=A0A976FMR2_BRELC|nr:hypothetical protein CCR75_007643 [Bremia lactucae]
MNQKDQHSSSDHVLERENDPAVLPSNRFKTSWTLSGCVIGSSFVLLVVLSAFLNATFLLWPLTILRWSHLLSHRSCTLAFHFLEGNYFAMLSGYLELVGGVNLVVTGDEKLEFKSQECVLLICNHRSEVDWIFFWNLAIRLNVHDRVRVMLKSVIRYAPGAGWAMLLLQYPYINRNWASDEKRLSEAIRSYKTAERGFWLAMFPEGTALCDTTLKKSHEFAEKQGEAAWNYVLQPRVKGFELCIDHMDPDYVVDLTVAYLELMNGIRPSPVRFLWGQFPIEVHLHVKRYHRSRLMVHKGYMDLWLKHRFAEKEERLRCFYETGSFEGEQCVRQNLPLWKLVIPGAAFNVGLCGIALIVIFKFPLGAGLLFAISATLSIIQGINFGK